MIHAIVDWLAEAADRGGEEPSSPEEGRHGGPVSAKQAVHRAGIVTHRLDGLSHNELDWLLVAYAVDRLSLIIYVFTFIFMLASHV